MAVTLPRETRFLYAGVAIVVALAVFTARSMWVAWQDQSGDARAEAILDLVGQRTPLRATDAPGAMAWLRLQLDRYADQLADLDRIAQYRRVAAASDRVPDELAALADALTATAPASSSVRLLPLADPDPHALRRQRIADLDGERFAVTRRRGVDTELIAGNSSSNRFLEAAAPMIAAVAREADRVVASGRLPAVPADRPPRPVRVYAIGEDGTLISRPWRQHADDRDAVEREAALLGARPMQPTFAPDPFFFHFDLDAASNPASYSGLYLDLGGRGLVSTLMRPIRTGADLQGVLAIDLAFDVDWPAFAHAVAPPVESAAVQLTSDDASFWRAIETQLPSDGGPGLRVAVSKLASRASRGLAIDDRPFLRHGITDDGGAVAAFQMAEATWLVLFFPKGTPSFPVTAVTLLGGLVALLFAGFEVNRRRADRERDNSDRALAEKQNLLNTMQVPLVVVDPNSDEVVSANLAATAIGIRAGSRFADVVWPEDRARDHYRQMQIASPEPRRAYGVPVAVPDEQGRIVPRYAVVRSVAVTAPIAALAADERHRLGVLFLLDRDHDLGLFAEELDSHARRDERRRLAGVLSHGVDTLARVLERTLGCGDTTAETREFTIWLAEYLERRIRIAAWLLDHWDATLPLPPDSVVGGAQFLATLTRWRAILRVVRADRDLRARLHWDNGTLAATAVVSDEIHADVDWPAAMQFTTPARGIFGLFVGEVLANAIRHGAPGSVPRVLVSCDRVRRELSFTVINQTTARESATPKGEAYGGLAMLAAIARLCEWRDLAFEQMDGEFRVWWRVPASERVASGAD